MVIPDATVDAFGPVLLKGFGHERVSCIHITEDSRLFNIQDIVKRIYGPVVHSNYAGKTMMLLRVKIWYDTNF